jgi:glycosyltransferase involved in cell wall biosynthesis
VLWERVAARWSDAVLCVSEGERSVGVAAGLTPTKLCVIPNGVPIPIEHDRGVARRRLGLDDAPLVVCIGRLARQKGQDLLLDSWRDVVRRSPTARLVLVGDGPERERLRAQDGAVTITIADGRRGVDDWLLAADVVVIPSRWEGMSLTMLDAMARARAVVSTDVSGSELLPHDARVPVDDAPALAESIAARLVDVSLREREGRANLDRVAELSVEQATAEVARLYKDVLARR